MEFEWAQQGMTLTCSMDKQAELRLCYQLPRKHLSQVVVQSEMFYYMCYYDVTDPQCLYFKVRYMFPILYQMIV